MHLNLSSLLWKTTDNSDSDRPSFLVSESKIRELGRRVYIFDGLEEDRIAAIISALPIRIFQTGALVYSTGDESDGNAYIVLSGEAEVVMGADTSAISAPGSLFGESALIIPDPRSHTVRARDSLECLVLAQETFMGFASENYELNKVMYRAIQRDYETKNPQESH